MLIIGCDFHTRYQQIAMAEDSTGEQLAERRLDHQNGEAHAFYRSLRGPLFLSNRQTHTLGRELRRRSEPSFIILFTLGHFVVYYRK